MEKKYILTEEMVQKIIDTPPIEIMESGIRNDLFLSKAERVKHAEKILENWKINK